MKNYEKLILPNDSAWDRESLWKKLPIWFKEFITGCKNIIKWSPTIWKQRDWDDHFIFDILQKKIEFQRKEIVGANRHTRVEQDNRDMTIVLNLIERVKNEYYDIEYLDYQESDMKWLDVEDRSDLKRLEFELITENFDEFLKKYPSSVRKVLKTNPNIDKERLCRLVSNFNQEKAHNLLFKILNERIRYWWD